MHDSIEILEPKQLTRVQKPDGCFRKIRVACFPDEIILRHCAFYSEWLVMGWRRNEAGRSFYDAFPKRAIEMQQVAEDPVGMLGTRFMEVAREIWDRVPLDFFGIDFDLDDDGNVVLFEAAPTMVLLETNETAPAHLTLPEDINERINQAFGRLVRQKIDQHATNR